MLTQPLLEVHDPAHSGRMQADIRALSSSPQNKDRGSGHTRKRHAGVTNPHRTSVTDLSTFVHRYVSTGSVAVPGVNQAALKSRALLSGCNTVL